MTCNNVKKLKKEMEYIRSGKDLLCLLIGGINMQRWSFYQKQTTDSMQSSSKFQHDSSQILKGIFQDPLGNSKIPG